MKKKYFQGISRNVFTLGLASLFNDISSEIIYPLLPVFLSSTLGLGTTFIGAIEGIADTTVSMVKLFSGWLSDKFQKRKPLITLGYGLATITRPLIALSTAGWQVLVLRMTDRFGKGVRGSPRDALIAGSTVKEFRGKAFGFRQAMDHLGAILGPIIAFLFLAFYPGQYRHLFLYAAIPGLLPLILIPIFVRETKSVNQNNAIQKFSFSLQPFNREFKKFVVIVFIFTLGNSSDAFLLLRATESGISSAMLPLLWILLHLTKFGFSTHAGILSDRYGRKIMIVIGWLIYAMVYFGFAFANTTWQIWILFAVYGLFHACTEGVERALVADLVKDENRGTAYGIYNFMIGIGALPASLILGWLWQRFGIPMAFSFGAVLALIASLTLWIFVRPSEKN